MPSWFRRLFRRQAAATQISAEWLAQIQAEMVRALEKAGGCHD